jgi:hypothetical protein
MKKILLTLLLFSSLLNAETQTISQQEIVGKWETHFGYGVIPPKDAKIDRLVVSENLDVSFEMNFKDGHQQVVRASKSNIDINSEIYVVSFNREDETTFKLVFSGYRNDDRKLLFGMLYLYNKEELFNGIPVSFKPSS